MYSGGMVKLARTVVAFMLVQVFWLPSSGAKDKNPMGVLAASVADEVVIVDPTSGNSLSVAAGPVAWLFPAPGGILFAPDLVDGRTTVIDLRSLTVREPIPGITMPHFGTLTDRYVVLGKQLLVMSYPDRALMNAFEIAFEHPWQAEILAGNTVLLVLERLPGGGGDVSLTAVSLDQGRLVYRRPLAGDVRHFASSVTLGVIALAEAESGRIILVDPATLMSRAVFQTTGKPVDVVFAGDGSTLVVAVEGADAGGELLIWKLKQEKKRGLQRKRESKVPLATAPVRLASSPNGRHVAVGLMNGELQIFEIDHQVPVATAQLREAPRDVVWCDPSIEGPLLPDWSDDDKPTLDLGGR